MLSAFHVHTALKVQSSDGDRESKMQAPTILMVLESNEVLRIQEHSKVQRTNKSLKIEEPLKAQEFEQRLKI